VRADQLVYHREFAAVPEALHGVTRMQGAVLIITSDRVVIKRQNYALLYWLLKPPSSAAYGSRLIILPLPVLYTDREQV
jgi:hypothetical protein